MGFNSVANWKSLETIKLALSLSLPNKTCVIPGCGVLYNVRWELKAKSAEAYIEFLFRVKVYFSLTLEIHFSLSSLILFSDQKSPKNDLFRC